VIRASKITGAVQPTGVNRPRSLHTGPRGHAVLGTVGRMNSHGDACLSRVLDCDDRRTSLLHAVFADLFLAWYAAAEERRWSQTATDGRSRASRRTGMLSPSGR